MVHYLLIFVLENGYFIKKNRFINQNIFVDQEQEVLLFIILSDNIDRNQIPIEISFLRSDNQVISSTKARQGRHISIKISSYILTIWQDNARSQ